MTTFSFQPDDPRLTAYALGELGPTERAQVEAMLVDSAEARTALEEVRETIGLLSRKLTLEPALTLTTSQREFVKQSAIVPAPAVVASPGKTAHWGTIARTATTVAAVAAVAVAVPWMSRNWQGGSQDQFFNAERIVASTSAPDATRRDEGGTPLSTMTSRASADESKPMGFQSDDGAVVTLNSISDGEAVTSFTAEEFAEKAISSESLATNVPTDNVQYFGPADSPSPATSDNPAGGPAGHVELWQDAGESKSGSNTSGERITGSSLDADNSAIDAVHEPMMSKLVASAAESKKSNEFKSLSESERAIPSLATANPSSARGQEMIGEAKASVPTLLGRSVAEANDGIGFGGFAGRGESEELRRFETGVELSKDSYARFRSLRSAAPGTEAYEPIVENAFLTPMEQSLSTFSIDVDTASYANMRRFIQQGQIPPAGAVRIEELVNYFRYDYPEPTDGSPFSVNIDVAACPWNSQNKLARVGLKAKTITEDKRPATNLVFLIDVSGSMAAENKLPLVKQALNILVSRMREDDQIAIATYAGEAGLKLNSTSGSERKAIQQAIDSLQSGGSTNGAAGINIAYDAAIQSFIKGGANRVILCTDGDFNVGVSDDNTLVEMIQEKAASGVFLSVFGFGMGNLKDAKLEKLADKGNGNYGYIDGLGEARKVFGEQLSGTLITVAKDVKLQLEFNNSTVGAYRLIGYENRVLAAKDFDDDTKDAGEIGAGHTVTALYEIVPKAVWLTQVGLNPEKFDIVERTGENKEAADGRLFTVKLRHKLPDAETSERSMDYAAMNSDVLLSDSNVDFRFAAAVASFGMQIRDSKFRGHWTMQNVLSMADASLSTDRNGERTEFTDLVRGVMRIKGESALDHRLSLHNAVAPATLPVELSTNEARIKATVDGKYRRLLKKIEVRSDVATYGDFRDFGHWEETAYSGHSDLPTGYWVWVYPNWYIWGDATASSASQPAIDDESTSKALPPNYVP